MAEALELVPREAHYGRRPVLPPIIVEFLFAGQQSREIFNVHAYFLIPFPTEANDTETSGGAHGPGRWRRTEPIGGYTVEFTTPGMPYRPLLAPHMQAEIANFGWRMNR